MKANLGLLAAFALAGGLFTAAVAQPVHNISGYRHPNLARAQNLTDQAERAVRAAQGANEFDLGGHAAKALELLDQANAQLRQAATTSNQQGR